MIKFMCGRVVEFFRKCVVRLGNFSEMLKMSCWFRDDDAMLYATGVKPNVWSGPALNVATYAESIKSLC